MPKVELLYQKGSTDGKSGKSTEAKEGDGKDPDDGDDDDGSDSGSEGGRRVFPLQRALATTRLYAMQVLRYCCPSYFTVYFNLRRE